MSQLAHTRPRSVAEIIDASFRIYRAHWGDLAVLSALLLVPPALLTTITPAWFHAVIQVVENLMFLVVQGASAVLVCAAIEKDRAISAAETLLYYDLRVRNEGADLMAMMEALPDVP
jgi:hypothetical protein